MGSGQKLIPVIGEVSKKYANLPERFIKRQTCKIDWKTPRKPQYLPRTISRKATFISLDRPWKNAYWRSSNAEKRQAFPVEPIKDWSFFRGDRVEVLVGRDKGKQGIVKDIIQERNWIIVEGLNMKLKEVTIGKDLPKTLQPEEQPLLVTTQVQLVDPTDNLGTPIKWRYTDTGKHVRVSVRTGRIIPIPASHQETVDYKAPEVYAEQAKDTTADDVAKVTFKPLLKTFEMDIMDKMGIKEDRIPKKTYWY